MEFIITVLYIIAEFGFLFLLFGLIAAGFLFYFASISSSDTKKVTLKIFAIILLLYSFANVFFGYNIAGVFINGIGSTGTAVTVDIRQTNDQYNNYWVMEYSVILETKDGEKIEATFRDDDFNLYPKPKQGYVYPAIGEKFSVRYLDNYPKAFTIRTNDNSEYAVRLKCDFLKSELVIARNKFQADSQNEKFKTKVTEIENLIKESGCGN